MITVAEPIDLDALRIRHEFLTVPDLRLSADMTTTTKRETARPSARTAKPVARSSKGSRLAV